MIAVLCPTRNRPAGLKDLVASVVNTSENAEVLAYVDEDQIPMYRHLGDMERLTIHYGPRLGPVGGANALVRIFPDYEVYGLVPDDATLVSPDWDSWVLDAINSLPKKIGVVSPVHNLGPHTDMPFVSREWINHTGWFAMPNAYHYVWPIVTWLIGEMTAIVHAPAQAFSIHHDGAAPMNLDMSARDAQEFFKFVSLKLHPLVEGIRKEMYS